MNKRDDQQSRSSLRAEFDALADDYRKQHQANISVTGEDPDYFSDYKIRDLSHVVRSADVRAENVLDFGCGIGNSIPFLRKYFSGSNFSFVDVSARSLEIAEERFPGPGRFIHIENEGVIPVGSESQDVVFVACVFHHIPHDQHISWLRELYRITRKGGLLFLYEHNPFNPLTRHAVNTCPLDDNAKLLLPWSAKNRAAAAGWSRPKVLYRVFFPKFLSSLRGLEWRLGSCPAGAQYVLVARK